MTNMDRPPSPKSVQTPKGMPAAPTYPAVRGPGSGIRVLVTGGAGFIGSHLVDYLMERDYEVIVVDSFFTGKKENVSRWNGHPK